MVTVMTTKPSPMNSGNERMPTGPPAVAVTLAAPAMAQDALATPGDVEGSLAAQAHAMGGRLGNGERKPVMAADMAVSLTSRCVG